jgi:predicted nucleic acid-binding protein
MRLVLDSSALTQLSKRSARAAALIAALRREELWPPLVPTTVMVESLTGRPDHDASTNRLLKICELDERLPTSRARHAAALRHRARTGSAVDATVVATADPGGTVLTSDRADLEALAAQAEDVTVVVL